MWCLPTLKKLNDGSLNDLEDKASTLVSTLLGLSE